MTSGRSGTAILILFLILFVGTGLSAQSDLDIKAAGTEIPSEDGAAVFSQLPGGYGDIELGMNLETVKDRLLSDPNFDYRGEPDVTMLPQAQTELIDCGGALFVDRAFFQFEDEKLYLIIMVMDQEYVDHYSIYSALLKKYGEPSFLNPSKANWEDENVIISLERPLSLKYIDKQVFERLQAGRKAESTMEALIREDFINSF
jgi:hypothetical protein